MDEPQNTYPRHLKTAVETALKDTPVVALLGPRQCGKTTLARTFPNDRAYVTLDDDTVLATAKNDPAGFVASLPDRVILDEVQRAPELLRAIKASVDRDRRPGRFLLTGSANLLLLPDLGDSLAGRMEILHLHPLTESEKERTNGGFLKSLITGKISPRITGGPVPTAPAARILAGGFPEPLTRTPERARQWRRQYLRTLMERDVNDIARVADTAVIARLLELLSLRNAELLNVSALSVEIGINRATLERYLGILEKIFLIRRLPAWHNNEAKRLVKTPKVQVCDSGLAGTLAGIVEGDWLTRRERFGHLLESFVVQQLVAQAGWTDPDLRFWHYRDKDGVEVDLVITRGRETWGVEIKASASVSPADGKGLALLAEHAGKDFRGGVLLYTGTDTIALREKACFATPIRRLWDA